MASALAAGASYGEIGDALGIGYDAARMRARRLGLRSLCLGGRPVDPRTPRRIQVARSMQAAGHDAHEIGDRLGMSVAAVRAMLRRAAAVGGAG